MSNETQSKIHADRLMIVTGGTGALGQAVTRRLLADGASVVVTYIDQAELDRLVEVVPAGERTRFESVAVNLTDPDGVDALVTRTLSRYRRIDGLVNIVGGYQHRLLLEMSWADWQRQLQLNLTTTFLVTRAVIKPMAKAEYGRIVSVGSQSAMAAAPGAAHYNAAKAAVANLMATVSHELQSQNIRANTVLPSTIDTPANRLAMPDADTSAWVPPSRIADVISGLLSAANMAAGTNIAL